MSLGVGAVLGNLIAYFRNRVKTLEYRVDHSRVAASADDAVFGSIRVTWKGHDVTTLYVSRVALENTTSADFTKLKVKVFTGGDTLLRIPGQGNHDSGLKVIRIPG